MNSRHIHPTPSGEERVDDAGAHGDLRKPVHVQQFAELMVQLALYWLILDQSPPQATPS